MYVFFRTTWLIFTAILCLAALAQGQGYTRELDVQRGVSVEVVNNFGRVDVSAEPAPAAAEGDTAPAAPLKLTISANPGVTESEIKVENSGGRVRIKADPQNPSKRIDISIKLPERSRVKIETLSGEARVSGNIENIDVKTETATIAVDVPTEDLRYYFQWTSSRPRFLSDFELEKVKEKSGGRFEIKGRLNEEKKPKKRNDPDGESSAPGEVGGPGEKPKEALPLSVSMNLVTARGIIIVNVPPNEVSSDLRERPLTNAAKAIIRSGDSLLMEAIRRASPKYFGDYAKTLPPLKQEPSFSERRPDHDAPAAELKQVQVRVTDLHNRAISTLQPGDFEVTENNEQREIMSLKAETAPFNLILLLDVSGSVDNYVTFIRKAARNFVDTVSPEDRISIVTFNEDVKVLSGFTTDKAKLSKSLDSFDAGGGTAYYDSLAYALTDTLRPLKGERTAIVVLSDGDDNHSFLSFNSLLGSIQESGALIYPLYVPSGLIAAASTANPNLSVDPLRSRYMGVNTKAEGEGEKLAEVSGGVYYSITQLSQLQKAYDDIVVQLRSAYVLTYRSKSGEASGSRASPRLKVKVKRDNAFVKLGPVTPAGQN
jgi:VWFA-related protein